MPTQNSPQLRNKSIKIAVTDSELEALKSRCPKPRLAEWMREHCLDVQPAKRRSPPPSIDPALLRQLVGMGNNLNQIARRINSGEWGAMDKVRIISALAVISSQLEELRCDSEIS